MTTLRMNFGHSDRTTAHADQHLLEPNRGGAGLVQEKNNDGARDTITGRSLRYSSQTPQVTTQEEHSLHFPRSNQRQEGRAAHHNAPRTVGLLLSCPLLQKNKQNK